MRSGPSHGSMPTRSHQSSNQTPSPPRSLSHKADARAGGADRRVESGLGGAQRAGVAMLPDDQGGERRSELDQIDFLRGGLARLARSTSRDVPRSPRASSSIGTDQQARRPMATAIGAYEAHNSDCLYVLDDRPSRGAPRPFRSSREPIAYRHRIDSLHVRLGRLGAAAGRSTRPLLSTTSTLQYRSSAQVST